MQSSGNDKLSSDEIKIGLIDSINGNISEFLSMYIANPDPKYAVFLKGKWGCGKSFFIDKWTSAYKEGFLKGGDTLEPIYVSLYGLKSTEEITKAIDRILHPILYSKGAEIVKKVFRIAGQIALKSSLDVDKDGKDDISLNGTLSSLSLLSSKSKDIGWTKLLIFDDIERCQVDMKVLLGYINNFVEHGECHVIIVGDETHIIDKTQINALKEFKEKTIGREFEVLPDIKAAISFFVSDEIHMSDWIIGQQDFIQDIFSVTKCDNLRILRQCLYDFNSMFLSLDSELANNDKYVLRQILATYIIVYCEFKGENHDLFKSWDQSYSASLFLGDEGIKSSISSLQSKYELVSAKYNFDVLSSSIIHQVVSEIDTGVSPKDYFERVLVDSQKAEPRQEKLAGFIKMSSEEFCKECELLADDIINKRIESIYPFARSLAMLSFFDKEELFTISDNVISISKDTIANYLTAAKTQTELYQIRSALFEGFASFMRSVDSTIKNDILEFSNKEFRRKLSEIPNEMETAIYNLSDANVAMLQEISDQTLPDRSCPYSLTSVFYNIDPEVLANNIEKLSNASLVELCQFLSKHYEFYCILGPGTNHFSDDLKTLSKTKEILQGKWSTRVANDKYTSKMFMKYMDGAIQRASGYCEQITV